MRNFSATEADGAWHLLSKMETIQDSKLRADFFCQIVEEIHHADCFEDLARKLSDEPYTKIVVERTPIFPPSAEAWRFFAYLQVVEKEATQRFHAIDAAIENETVKNTLKYIIADEARHVQTAPEFIEGEVSAENYKHAQFLIRMKRKWEHWQRLGMSMFDRMSSLILTVVYFVAGPFCYFSARKALFGNNTKLFGQFK